MTTTDHDGNVKVVPSKLSSRPSPLPPPPSFRPQPLPVILGGGLFLFAKSRVDIGRTGHAMFAAELLRQAQTVLQTNPTVTMELGQGIETGGIYSFTFDTVTNGNDDDGMDDGAKGSDDILFGSFRQLVLQFQIEGGNAWAQGVAYGIQRLDATANNHDDDNGSGSVTNNVGNGNNVHLLSLQVANMDASMNGTPLELSTPLPPRL